MTHERCLHVSAFVLIAMALPLAARAEVAARGIEFQVNTYTSESQSGQSVSSAADGDFVVVWQSLQDGDGFGVFARRFSSSGLPLAGEFQINTTTVSQQVNPSVAAEANGDFVVAWDSFKLGIGTDVFARRFTSAGAPLAGEFEVNTYTTSTQYRASVAADADGDFVIAWDSTDQDGIGKSVFAQRFSSAGARVASEFEVNTYTTDAQFAPMVAASASGDFVITWIGYAQEGSTPGIFAQRFTSDGTSAASEFHVNTFTEGSQRVPSVAFVDSGDFVIAWQSEQDGSVYGVFARRFSSVGAPLLTEFQVNTYTHNFQSSAFVGGGADGGFVVAWQTYQDADDKIFVQRFASNGARIGGEFQVNTYTTSSQSDARVAALTGGGFVVVWRSYNQDGSSHGIFAQRFAELPILDIDGNGATQPLTDGLLVLRRFFGFTGTTLTAGAVDGGCTRCDAAAIEPYIAGVGLALDIDGDGETAPLTDGLLALRSLFGFTGATLTTGAVDTQNCTRCDAAAIEPYLQGLV